MGKTLLLSWIAIVACACGVPASMDTSVDGGARDAVVSDAPPPPVPTCLAREGSPTPGAFCDLEEGWRAVCDRGYVVPAHWEILDGLCWPVAPSGLVVGDFPSCDGLTDGEPASCFSSTGSPRCLAPDPVLRCPETFWRGRL